ncbi:carbonyl reductase [NADPH] 1-like [Euwallacea fornicatus]|uniref:carbonyl reductase [NADPH] 1-like n=1 Tax=Euwallacea fornicatus TaxID=995702 RepID=UPI00338DCED5
MSLKKLAIVTGSNKGIGFAIVKGLCERFQGDVYLTARNVTKGQEAVSKLKALGYNPLFHQLDITSETSINKFRDHIKNQQGGIDILINNAGVFATTSLPVGEVAEQDVGVNYFGTLKVCEALFPLLRENARVVNVSSSAGHLGRIPSADLRAKLKDPNLTIENLNLLMKEYVRSVKEGKNVENSWGTNAYSVSKVGLSALTIIQQRIFDQELPNRNIAINHVHPGWVKTDMNSTGKSTIDEGARSSLFVALDGTALKGKYIWWDCRIVEWDGPLPQ